MPPNFICFFGHTFSKKRKTRDWSWRPKRGTGAHKNRKKEKCVLSSLSSLSLLSHFSLFFRVYTGKWVKIQIKSKTVSSFTHTISLLIVFGNFSKPPNMLSPPVDFFPLDDGILEGSMITCLMFARLHVYVTCTIPSLACIIAG